MLIVLPGEKVPDRADEGFCNAGLSLPQSPFAAVPTWCWGRGYLLLILDSATSPIGFAQNDKGEFL